MAQARARQLRADIGGRYLGDARSFLLFVPLWWGLSMIGVPDIAQPPVFAVAMLANALAFAAVMAVLWIFHRTWFRARKPGITPLGQILAAGATLGGTKSLVTVAVTAWGLTAAEYWEALPWRLAAGAFTGAWILPAAALVLATQARYQEQRDRLVAELLRNQLLNAGGDRGLRASDPTDERVHSVITEARAVVSDESLSPEAMAKKLRRLIDTQLRPLSHELWAGTSRKYTDFSVTDLFRLLVSHHRYWVIPTTVFVVMVNGPFVLSVVGFAEGLSRIVIIALAAAATLLALSAGGRVSTALGMVRLAVGTSAFTAVNEVVAHTLVGPFDDWPIAASAIANAVIFITGSVILGLAGVARRDNRDIRIELANLLGDTSWSGRFEGEHTRLRHRQTAELLHGRVQNRLLSVVLSLTSQPDDRHRVAVAAELEAIERSLLDSAWRSEPEAHQSVDAELAGLAERWGGIVAVSVSTDVAGPLDSSLIAVLGRLGEEAVSNGARHGIAGSIALRVERDGADIVLSALDDGVGPRNGSAGIGSSYFTHIAGRHWSLRANPDGPGSLLTVRVPLAG